MYSLCFWLTLTSAGAVSQIGPGQPHGLALAGRGVPGSIEPAVTRPGGEPRSNHDLEKSGHGGTIDSYQTGNGLPSTDGDGSTAEPNKRVSNHPPTLSRRAEDDSPPAAVQRALRLEHARHRELATRWLDMETPLFAVLHSPLLDIRRRLREAGLRVDMLTRGTAHYLLARRGGRLDANTLRIVASWKECHGRRILAEEGVRLVERQMRARGMAVPEGRAGPRREGREGRR